jgi:hypothetical protein
MEVWAVWSFLIGGIWVMDPVLHPPVKAFDMKSCQIGAALAEVVTAQWQERIAKGETPTYKSVPVEGMKVTCHEVTPSN